MADRPRDEAGLPVGPPRLFLQAVRVDVPPAPAPIYGAGAGSWTYCGAMLTVNVPPVSPAASTV